MKGKESGPTCSVIVLFDRDEPEPCLSSLLAQEGVEFEVIGIVNPGSSIQAGGMLKIIESFDRNPARRRNIAAAETRGQILAFIDDDARAPGDWLRQGAGIFSENPDMAGFGGANVAPGDQGIFERLSDLILNTPLIGSGNPTYSQRGIPRPARPGDLHLSNFFVKKDAFKDIGGFNEALGYGAEDSELMYVGEKRYGMKFWFFPQLAVEHRRRPFGLPYLKQRFKFRRQNGRLLLVYPSMYLNNRSLQAGVGAIVAAVIGIVLWPWLWKWVALFYYVITTALSLRSSSPTKSRLMVFIPFLPLAYFIHHVTYLFGLLFGILEGLFFPGPERLRRNIRR
jgi:glycosyltransferase involved in cell wall biosynthesis